MFYGIRRKSINLAPESIPWPIIKSIAVHIGADFGTQSQEMAEKKNGCIGWRLSHMAFVAAGHSSAALTSNATNQQRAEYIAFCVITHFIADTFRLPKWLDQVIHIAAAAYSARRWLDNQEEKTNA